MVKNKNKLSKHNSSGWLDNYSEEFSIDTNMKKKLKKYPEGGKVSLPEVIVKGKRPIKNTTEKESDWMDYLSDAGLAAQLAGAGASTTGIGVIAGGPLALAGYAMGVPDAVRDTYNNYNEGNYGEAALSATGLIPGLRLLNKLGKFQKASQLVNKADKFNKVITGLNIIDKAKEKMQANPYLQTLPKYPAGGYLDYQEGYKGFGVGPQLYQDNSYFRSIMPDNIENMEEQINKPSIFSGINNVLGAVDQISSQGIGLISNYIKQNQGGYEGLSEDAKKSFDFNKLLNFAEDKSGLSFDNSDLGGISERISGQMSGDGSGTLFGGLMGGQGSKGILQGLSFMKQNGGYLNKYQEGGYTEMPLGGPEYIHKSNVFNQHVIPVPKVHFSDDTSVFDMGVNLNDLVQMNGGRINKYPYGGYASQPITFNSNTQRASAADLQAANANDFLHTKMRKDRQAYQDDKIDWGFMNWAKDPVAGYLGVMSTIPIVGDVTKNVVGDSFLTRRSGYTIGQGLGRTTFGAGKIAGGIATGNIGMIGSGIGDVGEGVGSTVGNLSADSAIGNYDKSGYISGKRLANASKDFNTTMGLASKLYGTVDSAINLGQDPSASNLNSFLNNKNPYDPKNKSKEDLNFLMGQILPGLGGIGFQDGGMLDYTYTEVPEFGKGGLTPAKAEKMLHDKSFKTDKQRKYFGYIASKNKQNGGWLDSL